MNSKDPTGQGRRHSINYDLSSHARLTFGTTTRMVIMNLVAEQPNHRLDHYAAIILPEQWNAGKHEACRKRLEPIFRTTALWHLIERDEWPDGTITYRTREHARPEKAPQ